MLRSVLLFLKNASDVLLFSFGMLQFRENDISLRKWAGGTVRGGSRGWAIGAIASSKTYESNFTHHVFYNSENNRDIRLFCHTLLCHSSFVKYTSSLLQYSSEPVMRRLGYQMLVKSPPQTGWIRPWVLRICAVAHLAGNNAEDFALIIKLI